MHTSLEGATINRYQIESLLAHGGMSEIYLGHDSETGQQVAIKLVCCGEGEYRERFRREITTIAKLKNDHILPALDYGEYNSWYYLVTPYIAHGTLNEYLAKGPLLLEEVGSILNQLTSALQCAHNHDIVHRDIKPSNVLLDKDMYVYLADFGLVKRSGVGHSLTQTGFLIGTPEYMAPELVEEPATPASDIYSLGVLLYQMLTGRVPFKGNSPVLTVWKHLHETPLPPSALNPTIPAEVEQVTLRALARQPQDRFASMEEFAEAFQGALTAHAIARPVDITQPVAVHAISRPLVTPLTSPGRQSMQRFPAKALVLPIMAALVLLLLGFSLAGAFGQQQPPMTHSIRPTLQSQPTPMPKLPTPGPVVQPQVPANTLGGYNMNNVQNTPPNTGFNEDNGHHKHKHGDDD